MPPEVARATAKQTLDSRITNTLIGSNLYNAPKGVAGSSVASTNTITMKDGTVLKPGDSYHGHTWAGGSGTNASEWKAN